MKRVKCVALVAATAVLMLSGCGTGGNSSQSAELKFEGYPIKTDETLTYWQALPTAISTVSDNAGTTEFAKRLSEETGVKIEYIHPVAGQEETSLSLMVASGQMADLVEFAWANYNGGPAKNIKEKVILPLNDVISENAPHLKKYLEENPDIDRMIKTDENQYYVFPFLRGDKRLLMSVGGLIRRDWLEELNLEMPTTTEELGTVLNAFKERKNATAALSFEPNNMDVFLGNFSTTTNFYIDNGKVCYGPMGENYKYALETLHEWYEEGLLDPNFVSIDKAALDANVLNGKTGYTVHSGGGGLGTWLDNMKNSGERFDMVGIAFTKPKAGQEITYYKVETAYPGYGSVAITTACKNPALAARVMDYGYSDGGHILYNFGTEGESYTRKDGKYEYTDTIFNNSDGLTMSQAMSKYFRASTCGAFVQDKGYIDQFYYRPAQQESLDAWLSGYDKVVDSVVPLVSMNEEESAEYTSIMNEIDKYVSKMNTNFILGTNSLDTEYDKFISELKNLKIDRAIEIKQAAYDRYMAR